MIRHQHEVARETKHLLFQKAKAFNLGFALGALEFFAESKKLQKLPLGLDPFSQVIDRELERCKVIAKAIGMKTPDTPERILESLPLQIDGKPAEVVAAFKIGNIVGRGYFLGIVLIVTGGVKPDDRCLHLLAEAENLLEQAELPKGFLSPIRKLWANAISTARTSDFYSTRKRWEDKIMTRHSSQMGIHFMDKDTIQVIDRIGKEMEQTIDQLTKSIETTR